VTWRGLAALTFDDFCLTTTLLHRPAVIPLKSTKTVKHAILEQYYSEHVINVRNQLKKEMDQVNC